MAREPGYCLHKPTGQAYVNLGGKVVYLGQYGTDESRERYSRVKAEWLVNRHSEKFQTKEQSAGPVMAEICLAFLDHAKAYYGEKSSEYVNLRLAIKPISALYATYPAKNFGPAEFKAYRQWWLQDPDRTRQYVNKQAKRFLRVIKWAVSEGLMLADSHAGCKCVEPLKRGKCSAPEAPKVTTVDDAIIDRVLSERELTELSPIVADMVRFQRATGARPGEVCNLKPSMVDRSGDVWRIELTEHKTAYRDKSRVVFAGPKAQAILAKYLLRDADAYCFSPAESMEWLRRKRSEKRVTPPSCGNRRGKVLVKRPTRTPGNFYTTQSYSHAIRQACSKIFPEPEGLEGRQLMLWRKANWFAPNQLRHNRATEVRAELGLEAASAVLGHSSQQITLTYAEKNEQLARQSAKLSG